MLYGFEHYLDVLFLCEEGPYTKNEGEYEMWVSVFTEN